MRDISYFLRKNGTLFVTPYRIGTQNTGGLNRRQNRKKDDLFFPSRCDLLET